MKKVLSIVSIPLLFFCLTFIYLFPFKQGLMLLPLDLLISHYSPWYSPGTILLKNPYMQDAVVQLFPWKHFVFESLTHGILPLWNPYQQLGMPFLANPKAMVFYPLNLLFIFGEIKAWDFLLFSQIFLSLLFAYYLARDFKLKLFPSLLVAVAFALNSYMIGLLQFGSDAHTLVWWPLILLFAKRYLENQRGRYLFFTAFFLALSVFAGQFQYIGYFLFVLIGFIIYYGHSLKVKLRDYIFLGLSIVLGFGVSAVQLIPSIELFSYSHRGLLSYTQNHEVFSRGLMPPYQLFRLFAPDFFGNPVTGDLHIGYIETSGYFGIIPLFFSFFAMIFARKNVFVRFFGVVFILSLIFSLKYIGELLFLLKIPLITSGSGERIFTLVLFSGAILSGFGLSAFLEMKDLKRKIASIFVYLFLVICIVIGYMVVTHSSKTLLHNITFSMIILLVFAASSSVFFISHVVKKQEKILGILFVSFVVLLTFFDLFRFGYRFLTFSNTQFLYPPTPIVTFITNDSQKTLGRTYGLAEPELSTYLHLYTAEAYNPLYLLRTSVLLQSLQGLPPSSLSVDNKYFLTASGNNLKNTLDFLGMQYIVVFSGNNPSTKYFGTTDFQNDFKKIYSDSKYDVYRNTEAYPRFGLYYQVKVIKSDDQMLQTISQWNTNLRQTLFLDHDVPVSLQQGTGSATLLSSTINSQSFLVHTNTPALLYISDTFYPGWKASVNNLPTQIYRADYNFRAVVVPAGDSNVTFSFFPKSLLVGILVSIASLTCLIILSINRAKVF